MRYPQGNRSVEITEANIERFWDNVEKTDGCWEWTAGKFPRGYGALNLGDGFNAYTHRFSWLIHGGELPPGMYVCHACDNKPCVRPDHLFLGTPADNAQDASRKGLLRPGNKGKQFTGWKLTERDVREIKTLLELGVPQVRIAPAFGVTQAMISHIATGRLYPYAESLLVKAA